MAYIFDTVLIVIIVFSCIRHYIMGFTKAVLNLAKFFASILLASGLGALAANALMESAFLEALPTSVRGAIFGSLGYALAFAVSYTVLTIIINVVCRIKIPVLHKINELMGLALGLVIGVFSSAILATVFYTCIELVSVMKGDVSIMSAYYDSFIFKFIYDLKVFEYIRELW